MPLQYIVSNADSTVLGLYPVPSEIDMSSEKLRDTLAQELDGILGCKGVTLDIAKKEGHHDFLSIDIGFCSREAGERIAFIHETMGAIATNCQNPQADAS